MFFFRVRGWWYPPRMAEFRIDQATPGAGTPGLSRHDLVPGEVITIEVTDPLPGAGISYTWEIVDAVGSTATLDSTTAQTVNIGAAGLINEPCAFRIRLTVDDNGDVTVVDRIASVRTPVTGLRVPVFGETAPRGATLSVNDPDDSVDNAVYVDRSGRGTTEQNWRGWAEWAWELVTIIESLSGGSAPIGPAGGDLAGTYPNPTVAQLRGSALSDPLSPSNGQALVYVDPPGEWQAAAVAPGGAAGGDLAGTYPNPTVDGLQGRSVAATAPADGEALVWNNGAAQWEPGAVTGAIQYHSFRINGPLLSLGALPTDFIDGLVRVGLGTVSAVVLSQEIDGTGGSTIVELYKVSPGGVETQITQTNSLSLASGGGDKAQAISTLFIGTNNEIASDDRLGIKLTARQTGGEEVTVTVVMTGSPLDVPPGLPEDDEVVQALLATQVGTTFKNVGAVYLQAGTILAANSRVFLGCDDLAEDGILEIRDAVSSALIDTISNTGVPADTQPGADIVIPSDGWYELRLAASLAGVTATLFGYRFVYNLGNGVRVRNIFDAEVMGTTFENVGSVYLPAGSLLAPARIFAGVDTAAPDGYTLELRRESDSSLITTWTGTGPLAESVLGASVAIPADDWYYIRLAASGGGITARLKGVDWVVLT